MMVSSIAPILLVALVGITTPTDAAAAAAAGGGEKDGDNGGGGFVVHSLREELPFDDNGRLARHQFFVSGGRCGELLKADPHEDLFHGYDVHAASGFAAKELFPSGGEVVENPRSLDECRAVCLERGVDRSVVGSAMPFRYYEGKARSGGRDFGTFVNEHCRRVEVCLLNYHSRVHNIQSLWIRPSTLERVPHIEFGYGERHTRCMDSYIGHEFEFRDTGTGEIVDRLTIEHVTVYAVGEDPDYEKSGRNFTSEIEHTLHKEWGRHNRVARRFSAIGFKKGRLPDDIFASMGAFYYNNARNKVKEEWSGKGVFVNWWECDAYFVQIPWNLKQMWQQRLLELVEAWTGVELEQTDMYGLRQYESGARLLTHVDREATHAASLIVNVAQGKLSEPWPVEVHDHADRLHEVVMAPGDVVYYESAKCLHARNRPLRGDGAYYVNLFTHYRPIGDPVWYQKATDEWVPPPVVEVGECRTRPGGGLGSVTCDNPDIGTNLSPDMFTATSGDDLIDWWRRVGPKEEEMHNNDKKNDLLLDDDHNTIMAGAGAVSGREEL